MMVTVVSQSNMAYSFTKGMLIPNKDPLSIVIQSGPQTCSFNGIQNSSENNGGYDPYI